MFFFLGVPEDWRAEERVQRIQRIGSNCDVLNSRIGISSLFADVENKAGRS